MPPQPFLHDTGEGRAILLLHAFPIDASQWDGQVAALSDRYRCLRPDALGCGSSPPPPPQLTLDAVAASVMAALDSRGVDEVAVVGLSMGGYTAFALLRQHASRIRALVLADTRASADSDAARADRRSMADRVRVEGVEWLVEPMCERLLAPASLAEAHIVDPVRARIRRCRPEGVAACQEAMAARPDSTGMLAGIAVPTLVIAGELDIVTPPAEARQLAQDIPGAGVEIIGGAGHLSNLERPDQFTAAVTSFLDAAYPAR
jgi:pimeloyl-ACP methyl ester carboxylesterase